MRYAAYNLDRIYIFTQDYREFAKLLTRRTRAVSLRRKCGITFLRYYIAQHGLRMPKELARRNLNEMVLLEHVELEVLQIHRADNMRVDAAAAVEVDVILLCKLDGGVWDEASLISMYHIAIYLSNPSDDARTLKYRTGFLANMGYYRRYAVNGANGLRLCTGVQLRRQDGAYGGLWPRIIVHNRSRLRRRGDELLPSQRLRRGNEASA